jgi:glucose/arabinose dehydrogenase
MLSLIKRPLRAGFVARVAVVGLSLLGSRAPVRAQAGASVSVKVSVPASMRSAPFDSDRFLNVPPNFSVSVMARVPGARFLAVAPNGDVLVSVPGAGKVVLVRPQTSGDPLVSDFVTGLRNPHDIVFHTIGTTTFVYVSESHQINRFVYNTGDKTAGARQVVVAGLPDASSPELHGAYGHQLKNLALGPDHKLYVEISSTSNADPADTTSTPVRCAVYQYNADGTGGRLFARGLRNPEGLAFVPGTNELWATVNNRDNTAYPFHKDFDGDGSDDYGKVMPAYVDNHPPDEFTRVSDGANYGWPFANPNPDTPSGMDNMPFDPDVQNNPEGSPYPVDKFTRINKGIQAHSAALGVSFLQNTNVPQTYRNGAVIALHGSWNRTKKSGYKVIFFPWNGSVPGAQVDLVTGWLDPASGGVWGRPVDVVPDLEGNLLISDDSSGAILKLKPTSVTPTTNSAWTSADIAAGVDNRVRVLWTNPDGRAQLWTLGSAGTSAFAQSSTSYGPYPGAGWAARALALGNDGKMRALWTDTQGNASFWLVGADGALEANYPGGPYADWTARDIAVGSDLKTRVLWTNTQGAIGLWRLGLNGSVEINYNAGPYPGWTPQSLAVGSDNKFRVLWTNTNGAASFWTLNDDLSLEVNAIHGPYGSWKATDIAVGSDGKTRALWSNPDGTIGLWTMGTDGSIETDRHYGPYPGWTAKSITVGADGRTRVLWAHTSGRVSFWSVAPDGHFDYVDADPPSS